MNPYASPAALQRKVQFDIRLHFFRRGCENMEKMKRDHFKLDFNQQTEQWRVIKNKDELTKNHKSAENMIAGIMPENPTDPLCPVTSFRMYEEHMHPECDMLWPMPCGNVEMSTDKIWYQKNKHWGKNTLGKFMSDISKKCELSKIYTNHCIRVTGATVLTRQKFSASEIMSVTGHKSVQSLATYQKTQDKQKEVMGKVLFQSMTRKEDDIALPPPRQMLPLPAPQNMMMHPPVLQENRRLQNTPQMNAVQNKPNAMDTIVPFNPQLENNQDQQVPTFDLDSIINDVMNDENQKALNQQQPGQVANVQTTTNNSTVNVPRYMFGNCSIGHVSFNIYKQN